MNQLHYFQYHLDIINSVISFQDFFVSVSRDGKIGVSRISTQLLENLIHLEPFTVKSEVYHEDIVAYGSGSEVRILDLNDSDVYCELKGHGDSVQSICLSSDLDFLVSSSLGPVNNLIVWNISNRSIKSILIGHSNSVFCVDISSDDLFAISGDAFSYVMQWDLTSMKQTCIFQGHSSFVHSVKFSPDRNFAVSAGNDLKVIVWNLNQKSIQSCFDGHPYPIWKVLITRDSRFIVSADYFTGIYVWNVEKKGHESTFNNLDEAENWLEQYSELKREVIYLLF
jgi:WD40 repeat protein